MMVTAVYILTSLVFIYLVPMQQVTSGETFAAQAGEVLFGRAGSVVFSLVVVVAVLGCLAAVDVGAACLFAMARDGLFVRPSRHCIRYETPRTRSLCRLCLLRYS